MISDLTPFQTRTRLLSEYQAEIARLQSGDIPGPFPVQLEVNPSSGCNQSCHWCISENTHDNRGYYLNFEQLGIRQFFKDFKRLGGRFIGWSGGGEPTNHGKFDEALAFVTDEIGLCQGLLTHGAFGSRMVEPIARCCDWVRISIDTHDSIRYKERRGVNSFKKVEGNVEALINQGNVTVGLNMNVGEWNKTGIWALFDLACKWNVDYLQVRPTLPRPFRNKMVEADDDLDPKSIEEVLEALSSIAAKRAPSDPALVVSMDKFADMHMRDMNSEVDWGYSGCRAHELFVILNHNGDISVCMYQLDKAKFRFGNVYNQTLEEIWLSDQRRKVVEFCRTLNHGVVGCQPCCKGHEINKVLLSPEVQLQAISGKQKKNGFVPQNAL